MNIVNENIETGEKTIEVECPDCKGTGLYKSFCESGTCAVLCRVCHGSGRSTIKFKEFTGRKPKEGITRVFHDTHGFVHTDHDIITEDGVEIKFSQAGCTYQEWLNGAVPKPVKELYCPYMDNNRGMGNEPCSRCKEGVPLGARISRCKYFGDKSACWNEYESKKDKNDQ